MRVEIDPAAIVPDGEGDATTVDTTKPTVDGEGLPSDADGDGSDTSEAPEVDPDRPEWLPEKFATVEDMAKAYAELEKAKGTTEEPVVDPASAKIPETADVKAAVDIVSKAGLDFAVLNATYGKDGKLTDADYAALAKQSIPKAMVDSFIKGQIALQAADAAAVTKAAHEAAGGAAKYTEVVKWAAANLAKPQIEAFNRAIDGSDTAAIALAVSGLVAAATKAGAAEPKNLGGTEKAGTGGYKSTAEMMKDMGDPRYESDPAFRNSVERKLERSKL